MPMLSSENRGMRRWVLIGLLFVVSCNRSSSSGGSPPPPPAPPPGTPPPVSITGPGPLLGSATIGVPMSPITFTATGTAPISWNLTGGTLAQGLTLSTDGVLSGTPTQGGSFYFQITASDPNGSDTESFTHNVGSTVSETEPNDVGTHATGVLAVDDVDGWSFTAQAGQVVRAELFAIRREHASWNTTGNRPRLSLLGINGTDFLVGHDFGSAGTAGWAWGDH